MFKNLLIKQIVGAVSIAAISSCAAKQDTAAQVAANFAMTGSAKTATVAQNKKLWSLLLPSAYAFVSPSIVDAMNNPITLSSAWVSIKEVEFEAEEIAGANEVDGNEVSFRGPYFVDLLSTDPLNLDTQSIPAASYHRIKMKFHASGGTLPASAPAQLASNSVVIAGQVNANNFEFRLDDGTEINIGGPSPVVPADGSRLLVEINLADVFKQIDMSTVTNNEIISASNRHATTCPQIDASAQDIYTCVRKALEKRANFGKDTDGNGDLSGSEDAVK